MPVWQNNCDTVLVIYKQYYYYLYFYINTSVNKPLKIARMLQPMCSIAVREYK